METIEQMREKFKAERIESKEQQIRDFNSIPNHVGTPFYTHQEAQRYPVNMLVTEAQWGLMEEAFDLLKKQCQGYKQRAINNPSETIKSTQTIERQQKRINQLEDIISRFQENIF